LRISGVFTAALLLAGVPSLAQEEGRPDVFSDVIDVRVVNVEAVVTDLDGNRVRGLDAGDFELLVDGELVPIQFFSEIDDGVATTAADSEEREAERPISPSQPPDERVRTNYLIFIDEFFAIRRDRDRVLKRLEKDLGQLDPVDHVAIVAFDGDNVASLTGWTNAPDEVRGALRQARERKALGMMRKADLDPVAGSTAQTAQTAQGRQALSQASASGVSEAPGIGRTASSALRTRREQYIQRSVLSAVATVRSFADPPGRKVMLLLTDGWGVPSWGVEDPLGGRVPPSIEELYSPLTHAANLVGYTLYPVDLPGLNPNFRNSPLGIADVSVGYNAGSGPSPAAMPNPFASPPGFNLEWSQEAALAYLAHETGGLAMINSYRDLALAEAAGDTRSYYWLGFEPQRKQDDQLHSIDVRLAGRSDLKIRTRRSYFDLSKGAEVTMMVEGSLLFGGTPGKESLVVRFGAPQPRRGRKMLVPMEIAIPLDDVQLLPLAGRWANELEFRVTVINKGGERSDTPVEKIQISGPNKPPSGVFFFYETTLLLRSQQHRYVASVYDPLTGAILSASGTVGPR